MWCVCSSCCPAAVSLNAAAAPSHRRFFWQPHKLLFYYACVYVVVVVVVIRAYRTEYQIYMRNLHFKMNELLGYKQCRIRLLYMLGMLQRSEFNTSDAKCGDTMILIDSLRTVPPPSRLICIFSRTWKSLDIAALLINLFCDTFLFVGVVRAQAPNKYCVLLL